MKSNRVAVWQEITYQRYKAWRGETNDISLIIVPELGSKLVSLVDLQTGREWLWGRERQLGHYGYASSYADADGTGWDEMFPTIDECLYPLSPWACISVPDHGEVWSQPWQVHAESPDKLCLSVHGGRFPYVLEKRISFPAQRVVRFAYCLKNESLSNFHFLWAAHPLFDVGPGTRILAPTSVGGVTISHSQNERLGKFGDAASWPVHLGIRLDEMGTRNEHVAEKFYFSEKLTEGQIGLLDTLSNEGITLRFPTDKVPYVAVWMNCGGYRNEYNLALEPATGFLDSLTYAISEQKVSSVGAGESYKWFLEVEVNNLTLGVSESAK